jgi:signal transduction histidine kinase
MQLDSEGKKIFRTWGIGLPRVWVRMAVILGVFVLYFATFQWISEKTGPLGIALIMIPVLLTGWYFGIAAGLIVSLLGIILLSFLSWIYEGNALFQGIVSSWPGELILIVGGLLAGRLHKSSVEHDQMLAEARRRDRYLTLISMASNEIFNPKESVNVYFQLVTRMINLFVADYGYFVRWDAVQEKAAVLATSLPLSQSFYELELDPDAADLTRSVMNNGDPRAMDDLSQSQFGIDPAFFKELAPQAWSALCVPFITKNYKSGMVILAYTAAHQFNPEEIEYARLAGHQIALAICTFEQGLMIQEQLKEAQAFAGIEHILSEVERVGIKTVLQIIVDSARNLIPKAGHAVLHLVDEEKQILVPSAVSGYIAAPEGSLNMRMGEGIAGQVFVKGEAILVHDTQTDSRFVSRETPVNYRSLIVAPIKSKQQIVGTISINSDRPNAFTAGDTRMLVTLGIQAAVAIENASMLEITQRDLKQINALYHMSQGLVASLDPDQLMKDIVEFLHENFGYYHVQIFTVDPKNGDLTVTQGSGKIGAERTRQKFTLPTGSGIVGHAAEIGEAFLTNNVDEVIFFIRSPHLPDTQSEMAAPIKVGDRVVGVLDVQQTPPDRLSQRDMQLMTAVADQLAVALQKAYLYTNLQSALENEKTMRTQLLHSERLAVIGRLLASVSHELNNPLQAIQNALFLLKEEEKLSSQGSQDLETILSETERMSILLDRLRTTYRSPREEEFQEIHINDMVEDVHALTATQMRHSRITFEFHPSPDLPSLQGNPDQIRQVVLNLFVNAMEAMPSGGILSAATQLEPNRGRVSLIVKDTGPGIEKEILPHIFEPFITNKTNGTGLGLSITYDIVQLHSGDIRAGNDPEGGAVFEVMLPVT